MIKNRSLYYQETKNLALDVQYLKEKLEQTQHFNFETSEQWISQKLEQLEAMIEGKTPSEMINLISINSREKYYIRDILNIDYFR
jgi:hypothetical protein